MPWLGADRYGKLSASFDHEEMGRTLYLAGNREMDTYAHIRLAVEPSYLLELEHLQQDTLAQILDLVDEWGLKGVLLDLAYLPGREQNALFGFLNNLADNLRQEGKKPWQPSPDANIDYGQLRGRGLSRLENVSRSTTGAAWLRCPTAEVRRCSRRLPQRGT